MTPEERVDGIAKAIKDCTDEFRAPVQCYIEPESRHRYETEHPDGDAYYDHPGRDWDLESYKIIARAVEAQIAAAIRDAENDALERAAKAAEDPTCTYIPGAIRMLKYVDLK